MRTPMVPGAGADSVRDATGALAAAFGRVDPVAEAGAEPTGGAGTGVDAAGVGTLGLVTEPGKVLDGALGVGVAGGGAASGGTAPCWAATAVAARVV